MLAGLDTATVLLFILGAVVVFFLIDLLFAGGGMTGGMAGGLCGMMGGLAGGMAGAWWLLLPLLFVIVGLLLYDVMGSTWPMNPTISYPSEWLLAVLAVPLVLILVIVTLVVLGSRATRSPRRPLSPEEILRERYARGEISRQQYLDTLVDILKDRCARGELELDDYERRLDLLVQEPTRERRRVLERKE